jgi:hypothetical protein
MSVLLLILDEQRHSRANSEESINTSYRMEQGKKIHDATKDGMLEMGY